MYKLREAAGSSQRSSGQQPEKCGWNSTSQDYYNHLNQIMRTASVLPPDVPQYPRVYNIFKNKSAVPAEQLSPPNKKKVHIAEQEKTIISNNTGNNSSVEGSSEEYVDVDADSFIQQKQRGFELCKWTTFSKARD